MTKSQHLRRPETRPRIYKSKGGMYLVGGKKYSKLRGSRQEVMKGIAHHTGGDLTKKDFMITAEKVLSRKKHRQNKVRSNLFAYNRSRRRSRH